MWIVVCWLVGLHSEIDTEGTGATRAQAIAEALKEAVGRVAGVYVQSRFEATQSESSVNERTTFLSRVSDETKTSTDGFIESYQVLSERQDKGLVRVRVRANVSTRKLDDLFGRLSDAIDKRLRKPRVVVIAKETTDGVAVSGLAGPFIEGQLASVGLELGKDQQAADVVVTVDASYKNLGVIPKGAEFAALEGQVRSEVALVMQSTLVKQKRLLQSKAVSMTSIGINFERAIARALSGQGNNAIKAATSDFFAALLKELEREPASIVLRVEGVSSFKKQGQPLVELLKHLPKARQVSERGYEAGVLRLEVDFDGSRDELEAAIFAECERQLFCKSIDRASASATSLNLRL